MGGLFWPENRKRSMAIPTIDMIAPTTSSFRSSERVSQKFSETGSGAEEAEGATFRFFCGVAFFFDIPLLREGDFRFGFARDFDFLDELEKGVLSGIILFRV